MTTGRAGMSDFPIDPARIVVDPNFQAPDLSQAVEGWRAWQVPAKLPRFGVPPKLWSVSHRYYWVPRQESVAECGRCKDMPGESHTCGFYSAKHLEHLQSMGYHQYDSERTGVFIVIGQVANWGKVIEGSQGWRSQKSYPVRLWVPFEAHHLAVPLSEAYGVPVGLKNFLKPARAAR